ncbi:hypothetical protein RF11_05695 [Thelohanellus kitauei]|uniref:Integrase zinc-binding domain-containing protein n=1 Tax=Thelohanellus kitauei TaxID=669202 RepID=A0A0C2MSP8_THEKT|nr:hypothetical protein RF11_05695 [Thelohanellus kitauei]
MSINEFNFTICPIKGSGNAVADGLSRSTYAHNQKSQLIHDEKTEQEIIQYNKTLKAIRRKVNWPGMHDDVKDYVQYCKLCLLYKHQQTTPRSRIVPIVPTALLHTWHFDYIGPLPTKLRVNRYILLMGDHKNTQDAELTANIFMEKIIARFGEGNLNRLYSKKYAIDCDLKRLGHLLITANRTDIVQQDSALSNYLQVISQEQYRIRNSVPNRSIAGDRSRNSLISSKTASKKFTTAPFKLSEHSKQTTANNTTSA